MFYYFCELSSYLCKRKIVKLYHWLNYILLHTTYIKKIDRDYHWGLYSLCLNFFKSNLKKKELKMSFSCYIISVNYQVTYVKTKFWNYIIELTTFYYKQLIFKKKIPKLPRKIIKFHIWLQFLCKILNNLNFNHGRYMYS